MGKKTRHNPAESLADMPFSYRASKDGAVFVSWRGTQVTTLKGGKAETFLKRVEHMDERGRQMAMAKITGNFKRNNERLN